MQDEQTLPDDPQAAPTSDAPPDIPEEPPAAKPRPQRIGECQIRRVIASGGIRSLDDVRSLCDVAGEGIVGAITGRAIYEGDLDFAEGQKLADELTGAAG